MAYSNVTNAKLKFNVVSNYPTPVAMTTDGVTIEVTSDQKKLILITNSNNSAAKNATIKAGNAVQSVDDLAVNNIAANSTVVICVESGKFVNCSGELKGKILIKGDSDIKVSTIELP